MISQIHLARLKALCLLLWPHCWNTPKGTTFKAFKAFEKFFSSKRQLEALSGIDLGIFMLFRQLYIFFHIAHLHEHCTVICTQIYLEYIEFLFCCILSIFFILFKCFLFVDSDLLQVFFVLFADWLFPICCCSKLNFFLQGSIKVHIISYYIILYHHVWFITFIICV